MDSRYCEKCGTAISIDAIYCSSCGAKQSAKSNSTLKKDNSQKTYINIPSGHHFCAYCGEVKPDGDFWTLYDDEFCMCNKCHQRENKIYHAVVVSACCIVLFFTALSSIDAAIHGGNIHWVDNEPSFIVIAMLVFAVFHNPIYNLVIVEILKFTPWRISLSAKRKEWLRKCKDMNGYTIITPINRTINEEKYKQATGVYLSRDIPDGYYRCPCCESLHHISYAKSIICEDNDYQRKRDPGFLNHAYIQQTKIKYRSLVCPECYKIKNINKHFKIICSSVIILVALAVVTYIYYDVLKAESLALVILALIVGALIAGFLMSIIMSFVHKLGVYIFTRKKLFFRYEDAARYGAITPL